MGKNRAVLGCFGSRRPHQGLMLASVYPCRSFLPAFVLRLKRKALAVSTKFYNPTFFFRAGVMVSFLACFTIHPLLGLSMWSAPTSFRLAHAFGSSNCYRLPALLVPAVATPCQVSSDPIPHRKSLPPPPRP